MLRRMARMSMMGRMYAPKPKCHDADYIDFLIATPKAFCCTEAAAVQPQSPDPPAHDAFTRLLHRLEPDPATLWVEARPMVHKEGGLLVLDDSTLDKHYAKKIEPVARHWSGKHKRVVWGINLITLVWTDGDRVVPCDYRLYDKANDGLTKNDHFLAMLKQARARGFAPRCVAFDAWYSGKENLKAVRACGWTFLTQVRCNRRVNPDRTGNRPIRDCAIAASGAGVHLEGFGLVKAFRIVARNGDTEHWITNDLTMGEPERLGYAERAWGIEEYHRGLKQHCGAERGQVRYARAVRNHVGCAIRAFVR